MEATSIIQRVFLESVLNSIKTHQSRSMSILSRSSSTTHLTPTLRRSSRSMIDSSMRNKTTMRLSGNSLFSTTYLTEKFRNTFNITRVTVSSLNCSEASSRTGQGCPKTSKSSINHTDRNYRGYLMMTWRGCCKCLHKDASWLSPTMKLWRDSKLKWRDNTDSSKIHSESLNNCCTCFTNY